VHTGPSLKKKNVTDVDPKHAHSSLGGRRASTDRERSFAPIQSKPMMISISASKSEKVNGAVMPSDKPALGQCALFVASTLLMGCQTRGEFAKPEGEKMEPGKNRRRRSSLVRT
jgi:hypothetical protein